MLGALSRGVPVMLPVLGTVPRIGEDSSWTSQLFELCGARRQ